MTPDNAEPLQHSYAYHSGWLASGCAIVFFSLLGLGGSILVPVGWEKIQNGQLPLGVAFIVIGLFAIPLIAMAVGTLLKGIRQAFFPPRLGVTATALRLPRNLREASTPVEKDEHGATKPITGLAQPDLIPFASIRRAQREGPRNPGSDRIVIVHELSPALLVIEQYMMRTADFEELEAVLRAAIPAVFAPAVVPA